MLIDTSQNKVSGDRYHVTISRAQAPRGQLFFFFKLTPDQVLVFDWIASLSQVNVL